MPMPRLPALPIFIIIMCGLLLDGCKRHAQTPPAPVPVHASKVTQRTVPLTRSAVGLIQPLHTVALQSQVDGVIEKILFKEGDEVAAGTLLIKLDQRPFQNTLTSAKAGLAQARANGGKATADLERYDQLHLAKAISDADYSQYSAAATAATAGTAVQEAAVANAQLDFDYTEIRAPIAGRTSRLALREGSLVKANDSALPLLTLNQMAPIGVAFSVPEADLAAVRTAFVTGPLKVTAQPQGDGGKPVAGVLDYIDNTVGMTTGTVALRATFENTDRSLWPGQFVNVVIYLGELPDAIIVPSAAIVAGQQGDQVFVVKEDGTIDVRPIHTGVTDGDYVVVLDAVKAGETVVTDGQIRLVPGTHVTIKTSGTTKPDGAGSEVKSP
jgi:membrane fusion protein, multidrug efflux system